MRCSTVAIFTPSRSMAEHNRVSVTRSGATGMSTGGSTSRRRKTIPVSGGAGRRVISTLQPVCSPTPVARTRVFSVYWEIMPLIVVAGSRLHAT